MSVSIIIAVRDAAATLAETLDSVLAQHDASWEALVIDDGSVDATAAIADGYAESDARLRVIRQAPAGVSAARNAGIVAARHDWLLFLDGDDRLDPRALDRLARQAAAEPDAGVVCGGWVRFGPSGETIEETWRPERGDELFLTLARFCPFAIHSCMVRRSLVERVGMFDPRRTTCEDWDLWQRVARTGARFAWTDDVVAYYRMRPASAGMDAHRVLADGLQQIELGHGPDPRVPDPARAFAGGAPPAGLAEARWTFACWPAGLLIGQGEDGARLLDAVPPAPCPSLDPHQVAATLARAMAVARAVPLSALPALWPELQPGVDQLLNRLQERSTAPSFGVRVLRQLKELIVTHAPGNAPGIVGRTHYTDIEVTEPLGDVTVPDAIDRVVLRVVRRGEPLGAITLPAIDGHVRAAVIADVIADRFAWRLLGDFFASGLYQEIEIREQDGSTSWWRGPVRLAESHGVEERPLHDRIGWVVFLQELWDRPAWAEAAFYDPTTRDAGVAGRRAFGSGDTIDIDVCDALPALRSAGLRRRPADVRVLVRVAGVPVAHVPLQGRDCTPQQLRAAITAAAGYELCRVAVRESLVGAPPPESLRAGLLRADRTAAILPAAVEGVRLCTSGLPVRALPTATGLALGRHHTGAVGSSASRRATLPAAARASLEAAARAAGEPVFTVQAGEAIAYAPELFWEPAVGGRDRGRSPGRPAGQPAATGATGPDRPRAWDRHGFEAVFAAADDPWVYASPYEQRKYEQTLALLPEGRIGRALEIGCATGFFTNLLAPRVEQLVATDIAQLALERAALRCAAHDNITFRRLDLVEDTLPGPFDLIVCSEVLYYLQDRETLARTAARLAAALAPGGYLLMAHTHVLADDPAEEGLDWDVPFGARTIGTVFASEPSLEALREARSPVYRIHLLRRAAVADAADGGFAVVDVIESLPPEPRIAARFRRGGPVTRRRTTERGTWTLPILMYHRIGEEGADANARYRLAPGAFEEQLRYLRDAGFRSIGLDEWAAAARAWAPLPGRTVLLTFDDGDRDFVTHTWPLLERYGFSALVFLVTGRMGGRSTWMQPWGETVALMDWDDARALEARGCRFGGHTATHPHLTALPPADVVRELAECRAALHRELAEPIPAIAYPFGAEDDIVQHLAGACGFVYGLSCRAGAARMQDPLLALPRIEVRGDTSLDRFISSVASVVD